jgi:hypothetical protein
VDLPKDRRAVPTDAHSDPSSPRVGYPRRSLHGPRWSAHGHGRFVLVAPPHRGPSPPAQPCSCRCQPAALPPTGSPQPPPPATPPAPPTTAPGSSQSVPSRRAITTPPITRCRAHHLSPTSPERRSRAPKQA